MVSIEAVQAALLEVPSVVDTLEDASAQSDSVNRWLKKVEMLLASKRLAAAGKVASFRAVLTAAGRGRIHEQVRLLGKPSRSKLIVATAALVLEWTVDTVRSILEPEEARFQEAEDLAMRLVAIAQAKGVVGPDASESPPELDSMVAWLDSASADPDLLGGFVNLAALVGRKDSLRLLAQSLDRSR
jgi:hypothetical protein